MKPRELCHALNQHFAEQQSSVRFYSSEDRFFPKMIEIEVVVEDKFVSGEYPRLNTDFYQELTRGLKKIGVNRQPFFNSGGNKFWYNF